MDPERRLKWLSQGAIDAVHGVILRMAHELEYFAYFTRPTLAEFESLQSFDTVPLYALIHELIYLQGYTLRLFPNKFW